MNLSCGLKNRLRKAIKNRLNNVTFIERQKSSQAITRQLINSELFIRSENIASYIPLGNELDTSLIIQAIFTQHKNCYLPLFISSKTPQLELGFVKFMGVLTKLCQF